MIETNRKSLKITRKLPTFTRSKDEYSNFRSLGEGAKDGERGLNQTNLEETHIHAPQKARDKETNINFYPENRPNESKSKFPAKESKKLCTR